MAWNLDHPIRIYDRPTVRETINELMGKINAKKLVFLAGGWQIWSLQVCLTLLACALYGCGIPASLLSKLSPCIVLPGRKSRRLFWFRVLSFSTASLSRRFQVLCCCDFWCGTSETPRAVETGMDALFKVCTWLALAWGSAEWQPKRANPLLSPSRGARQWLESRKRAASSKDFPARKRSARWTLRQLRGLAMQPRPIKIETSSSGTFIRRN